MTRPRAGVALVLALAASILLSTAPVATASPHSGPSWTWDGPASWDASYGTYGITVLGDDGATLDLGFSSTICATGATWEKSAKSYFKGVRKQLNSAGWDVKAGKITHPSGFSDMYRRQVLKGTNGKKDKTTGEITLDYDFTTNVDGLNYCYQRSLAKYSDTKQWKSLKKTLNKVQKSLAYSGPGAPEGEDPDEF
jgi:hypothetical protein